MQHEDAGTVWAQVVGKTAGASILGQIKALSRPWKCLSHVSCCLWIPNLEKMVQYPFGTLDPELLIGTSIFGCKGLS